MSSTPIADGVVVCNPVSGTSDHVDAVERHAERREMTVRTTESAGDGRRIARDAAAAGASTIVAAGGDGTVNEVVAGVLDADALAGVTVAVVPSGTGNNFAGNVGIDGIDDAFAAIDEGERRRVDLGIADDRPFVNSCVGGLTADASDETDPEMKDRLGVLAYFVTTLQSVATYDELTLEVTVGEGSEASAWSGEAIAVLAGNARRFTERGSRQANVEDGQLEVTIVEDAPATDLLRDAAFETLFDGDGDAATHLRTSSVELRVVDDTPTTFSLDGETVEKQSLSLSTKSRALELVVGDAYEPNPDAVSRDTDRTQIEIGGDER